jgi:hypothetical protein
MKTISKHINTYDVENRHSESPELVEGVRNLLKIAAEGVL